MNQLKRVIVGGALVLCALSTVSCFPDSKTQASEARLTLFVGVDISGSFISSGHFEDSIRFLAHYLYAHLHGFGGLEMPRTVFVGSIGGSKPDEPKTFYPIQTFQDKSVSEIERTLMEIFPRNKQNPFTDYNAFFEQIETTVRDRKMVLRPISIVMVSDGLPDVPGASGKKDFSKIKLTPLEKLSRNVTLRLIYTNAVIGKGWRDEVKRKRVKVWTTDSSVMVQWKDPKVFESSKPIQNKEKLFEWIKDNVDFNVRAKRVD